METTPSSRALKLDFRFPTPIASTWTADVRRAAFGYRSAIPGADDTDISFARLKATYAHDNLLNELGKHGTEDPQKRAALAFANLKENRAARRNLAALDQARAYSYGPRAFGPKTWYADKPFVARRLKTQDQRRTFRLGLKSCMEFLNQLRISDLQSALADGDSAVLSGLHQDTAATVEDFRAMLSLTSPLDILKLFAPDKVEAITNIVDGIDALADFNQKLALQLASHSALEPIHGVVCEVLRSGTEFASVSKNKPLSIAAQAVQHQCSKPDADAVFPAKKGTTATRWAGRPSGAAVSRRSRASSTSGTARRGGRPAAFCYDFQRDTCHRLRCIYAHQCRKCLSQDHGADACPSGNPA